MERTCIAITSSDKDAVMHLFCYHAEVLYDWKLFFTQKSELALLPCFR